MTVYSTPAQLLSMASRRAPVVVSGKAFSRLIRDATATERGLLADALRLGAVVISPLLGTQAIKLAEANATYACLAHNLSPAQEHNLKAGFYTLGKLASQNREPDHKADKAIRKLGVGRLQAAIDRYVSPGRAPRGNGAALPAYAALER